mmetsp:Transcript_62477/g.141258  ORF Transcript_62477/g.141258 Transcript_62477/m.141258 type:complete len:502 (+) Transcript_62477:100-1605(+)|eukprot:CAMPEP_0172615086 /NCGR_PEP_ID=MMETSP1068-20121228/55830_1 /TAXON_ID=35684 /ORGANISM="Pseudopedinella elastica, Strain CCMP716" /LENGTH=501 /DNA_ID=CAMNT_0013420109 /DNA_START=76 /DNA_END=1581 /DNA_ORIENTATION=+
MATVVSSASSALVGAMDKLIILSNAPRSWPPYATRAFGFLVAACFLLAVLLGVDLGIGTAGDLKAKAKFSEADKAKRQAQKSAFRRFQASYLTAYLITMLADWLQGTNMYTLYSGYDMPVGILFITGFTSSAVFGTFVGIYVDQYGRKMGCVLFCLLEIAINILEHFPNFWLLILGRVMGGISTSLLFSAFESWMVTEHRKRGFPEEWLATTHGLCSTGNGLVAVLAGVVAQLASDAWGDIGPFRLAVMLSGLCLLVVVTWPENHGTQDTAEASAYSLAVKDIRTKTPVWLLGVIQSLYEGAMFTFVFVWVPKIFTVAPSTHLDLVSGHEVPNSSPPLGLLFASFMVCITIGGMLFTPLNDSMGPEWATTLVTALSACSMVVPVVTDSFPITLAAFMTLEACVGCWFACSATLRSKYIDDKLQSSIMTIFRVPLNALVVIGTRLEQTATLPTVFTVAAVWFGLSCVFQSALAGWADGKRDTLQDAAVKQAKNGNGNGKKYK